jgi:HPt (histidine-containing phosphotransfer) domain-containing protein
MNDPSSAEAAALAMPPRLDREQLEQIDQLEAFRPGFRRSLRSMFERNARQQVNACAEAAAGTELEVLRKAAHALKGTASSVGAARLSALSARIEQQAEDGDAAGAHATVPLLAPELAETLLALEAWPPSG